MDLIATAGKNAWPPGFQRGRKTAKFAVLVCSPTHTGPQLRALRAATRAAVVLTAGGVVSRSRSACSSSCAREGSRISCSIRNTISGDEIARPASNVRRHHGEVPSRGATSTTSLGPSTRYGSRRSSVIEGDTRVRRIADDIETTTRCASSILSRSAATQAPEESDHASQITRVTRDYLGKHSSRDRDPSCQVHGRCTQLPGASGSTRAASTRSHSRRKISSSC